MIFIKYSPKYLVGILTFFYNLIVLVEFQRYLYLSVNINFQLSLFS